MKKLVHYAILGDMKKYIKDFNSDDYDFSYTGASDPSVIKYARDYYARHLPVDVTAWIRVNEPDEKLIYKDGLGKQVCFVRDTLCNLLFSDYTEKENYPVMVISTHTSKSVLLPVYQINIPKHGIEIILRYNFYDWKVSIASKQPIECDFMGLFDTKQRIPAIYCEGFPEEKVYGSYSENHSKFTFEIRTNYDLYTCMFLLSKYLESSNEELSTETIYGMPIVPYRDKNNVNFGCFEGIVIAPKPLSSSGDIEIMKMVNRNGGYYTDSWTMIPFEEVLEHETSGKAMADFLVSKARELGDGSEEIAICENLALKLNLLDETWENLQKFKKDE